MSKAIPSETSPLLPSSHHSNFESGEISNQESALQENSTPSLNGSSSSENEILQYDISPWRISTIMGFLGFLIFLQAGNMTILTTIQGSIAEELQVYESVSWLTSSFLMAYSAVIPITGKLVYIVPPRIMASSSAFLFGLGTLISGFAPSLVIFLIGRVISGIGVGTTTSVSIVYIVQILSPKRRGLGIGYTASCFTFGVSCGAIFAGALEPVIGWRGTFIIQVPLFWITCIGLHLATPSSVSASEPSQSSTAHNFQKSAFRRALDIDYIGATLLIIFLLLLLYGLSTPTISWLYIFLSVLTFPVFLYQEAYRHPDPIVPIAALSSRASLATCVASLGFMIARWGVLFYSPTFGTAVRLWAPAEAGTLLLPTNIGFAVGSLVSGALHIRKAGSWYISSLIGFVVFPATLAVLAQTMTRTMPVTYIVLATFVNGACAGALVNYTTHHCLYVVEPSIRFIVSSILALFRGFAGSFGAAVGGGIFTRVLQQKLNQGFADHGIHDKADLIRRLLASPGLVRSLTGIDQEIARTSFMESIQSLFFAGVGLSLFMVIVMAVGGSGDTQDIEVHEEEEE